MSRPKSRSIAPLSTEETTQFRDDQLFIVWPHAFRTTTIQTAPPEPFFHEFALSPSVPRIAKVRPSPHASMLGPASENQAKLCIQRDQPTTPQNIQPVVSYDCPVSGQCIMKTVTPEGWASGACSDQSALPSILQNLLGIGSAYANMNGEEVWTVPSLSTLYRRLKNETDTFVGFTDFEIETDALKNLEADTYTMEVFANGMPIWLNGIPPADSRHHFDAEDGILVRFGLENLTFAGRKNGCETLEVKLDFFKDNKSLDKPLILTRQYAALRHAKETVIDTPNGEARWSGLYQSPGNRKETGLFVGSSKIFHKDDKQAAIKAREFLNEKRKILDAFNWTIKRSKLGGAIGNARGTAGEDDLKIVGKIRPPTKARPNGYVAYGLLVGTEQPNGQLQFSFDWQQIKKLREILLGLRKTEGAAKDIIPASVEGFYEYTYTEERKNAPNWVCDL